MVPAAQQNERSTGIPASVTIGQAALETGWGRSKMSKPPINSYFSIKCTKYVSPYQSGCIDIESMEQYANGVEYAQVSPFRTYLTVGDSLLDYGRLLTSNTRYAPAFKYTSNADQFIREIHKAGYATDVDYADKVISIMKRYNLYAYNRQPMPPGIVSGYNPDWFPKPLPANPAKPAAVPEFVPGPDFPAYAIGAREQGVYTLQYLLNVELNTALVLDGIFGVATDDAVREWQNRVGAKPTGVMDDETWQELLPRLSPGARGAAVSAVQLELRQAGFSVPVTGVFDATTTEAVKAFQRYQHIQPSGVVGTVVWARFLDW
nr:glucosaminidase domain-containing protein [Tessaracoccus sp. OS52]